MHIHIIDDNPRDAELLEKQIRKFLENYDLELRVVRDVSLADGLATATHYASSSTPFLRTYSDLRMVGSTEEDVINAIPRFLSPVTIYSSYDAKTDLGNWGYGVEVACLAKGATHFVCKNSSNFYADLLLPLISDAKRAFAKEIVEKKASQKLNPFPDEQP